MLTGGDPTAVYMIEHLRAQGLLDDVYRVVWNPRPPRKQSGLERLKKLAPERIARRLQDELIEQRFESMLRDMSRELFDRDEPPRFDTTDTVEAHRVNGHAFAAKLAENPPDILLVNGAPILKEPIYSQAKLGTVNCHFGIAPRYRGSFTLFWPLYHHDYENVGVTLHYLTGGLDAGPIVGHGFPALAAGDREGVVMAKCARVASDLMVDYLEAVREGRLEGMPQTEKGRVYRKRDRTGLHDARLWLERAFGLVTPPLRPPRRVLLVR